MDEAEQIEFRPTVANRLAWMNTILGLQNTLMAAERTAVTLIAFGFTVAQLFENLQSQVPKQLLALGPNVPRDVGLLMVAAGAGLLAIFTWEYRQAVAFLSRGQLAAISINAQIPLHQLTCISAYAIMVIGVLAFASVFVSF